MNNMTFKIALLGANGQVGSELLAVLSQYPEWEVVALTRAELDITDADAVKRVLSSIAPDIVVNAIAYTQVDKAESEAELAYSVNALGPKYLAEYTHSKNALLLHISTDYVFSGEQSTPYLETDSPDPVSQYGLTKLQGERFIQATCTYYMILRTAWVFGQTGNNFVKTMLRLAHSHPEISVVNDQMGTPTYAHDIALAIHVMLKRYINEYSPNDRSLSGIYHFTGSPALSWFEFAEAIFHRYAKKSLPTPIINPISTAQYPTPAKRPAYSLLSNNKIQQVFDIMPSQWQLGLNQLLQDLTCK
jgi:dTDP-4-dehydrorhamnose reductase